MIAEIARHRYLILDGAMGTELQKRDIPDEAWEGKQGCNELLNVTYPDVVYAIHRAYLMAGADIIKTNTFGALPWVLEEYDISERAYELAKAGAQIAKRACEEYSTPTRPRFVAASIGPGTKLPSLGHTTYEVIYEGVKVAIQGVIDGGADLILLETCQDPLQIKAALHACEAVFEQIGKKLPIMVSATMELSGSMLIGTDAPTLATILEPFELFSLGFNCGTGPEEVWRHAKALSELWHGRISIHANAGLPQNRGGYTFYPMGPDEFAAHQSRFAELPGVALLGGCCGTTPQHILALARAMEGKTPKPSEGRLEPALASLFQTAPLKQENSAFLVGERSNATGSKAFRELLLAENFDGTLEVAQEQVRAGAHALDVSVGFAGRDERRDMSEVISRYTQKIPIPLMVDSTQPAAIETALRLIGGRPIINSANLEDGKEKFDTVCRLAKKYGAALVLLAIDEEGMAKDRVRKVAIAERMLERAVTLHGLRPWELVFDLLTFTVGSGEEEYRTAAIETIEAIRQLRSRHPEVGAVLGISNISFGLDKHAREYLNAVFLHLCVEAGLTMAIVNAKNVMPMHKIAARDQEVCLNLLLNRRENGDPLFAFINHFAGVTATTTDRDSDAGLTTEEKLRRYLIDGDKGRMLALLPQAKDEIPAEIIVNSILIDAMKEVGELFGSGKMQLPFVLQSAEVMKASVDWLNPYLPKSEKSTKTTLVLGTVKGDVHDVGKNLVDIILTNNGYKVVNIGIKADIETFIRAVEEHNADAIGMSGLLVKSTLVMKENLEELSRRGIKLPVLLGGAALTARFVEEFCRPVYEGPVFYCRDAFDGIAAMARIEAGDFDTNLADRAIESEEVVAHNQALVAIDPAAVVMPDPYQVPTPPFWGRRVVEDIDKELAFTWINHRALFKDRWGYKAKGMTKEAYARQLEEVVHPAYERLKKQFLEEGLFAPVVIYGYYPCEAQDHELVIFDPENHSQEVARMAFPRQTKSPHRALSDYFAGGKSVVPLTLVSAGVKLSEYERTLYEQGLYHEYFLVHGLGVELAEALAEIVHKIIRIELGVAQGEGGLDRVTMRGYQGARYSPGYPACPDLELNIPIFKLLKPEEFGITLSETFQIHPEQSTCAIVVLHPKAIYYSI